MTIELSNMRKKNQGITECDKSTVRSDVSTAQCENEIIKCEKKGKGTIKCDNRTVTCKVGTAQCEDGIVKCEKKSKETTECDKYVRLELHNVRMKPSNVRKM